MHSSLGFPIIILADFVIRIREFISLYFHYTTNYQFVNIVDKTNGTELTDQPKISLTRDTAHDFNTRYVFRKTFKFSEIGEDIFKIRNSTQEK